ncbi:MAG: CotH kinase family protein [Eubacteriales bacterium]|nr:CotH kinase family protein [Eubacteriales bacterium]
MKRKVYCMLLLFFTALIIYWANDEKSRTITQETRVHQHMEDSAKQVPEDYNERFSTHLPLVLIDTQGNEIIQEETVDCKISIIDNEDSYNYPEDTPQVDTWATIRIRGNSSSRFDKKQYRITFVEEKGSDKEADYPVMGMKAESDWVLNAPYLDKTLMRNYMMYNISGEIMDWAPNVRFCEMMLNGEYMGLYLMIEKIKVSENRLNLTEIEKGQTETSYLISREREGQQEVPLNNFGTYTAKTTNEVGINYPSAGKLTDEWKEYIRDDLSDIEKALYSLDYDEWDYGYARYLDVDSFVDYFIINEFSMNMDAGVLSTYAYKDLRGKLTMGPVWDFNNCFDNFKPKPFPVNDFNMKSYPWFVMLCRDEIFVDLVIERYHELREGVLSEEYLMQYLDDTRAYLGDAIDRNFEVWGYSFQKPELHPRSRDLHSYEEAIEQLKTCIHERGTFMDEHIDILKQFCAESSVKEYN